MDQAQRRVLAIAWQLAVAHRMRIARIVAVSLAASTLAMLQPYLSMIVLDAGALAGNLRVLAASGLAMLLAPLLGIALEAHNGADHLELSSHVLFRLRERVFAHLQALPQAYYARVGAGELAARFDGDLAEVQRFAVDAPLALLGGAFNLALLVALMAWLHPLLAAVVMATVPLQLAATWRRRRGIEAATRDVRERAAGVSAYFLDSLRMVKLIQSTNAEEKRLAGLRQRHDHYLEALRAARRSGFAVGAWQRLSNAVSMALVTAVGSWLLMKGEASVGVLVAFVAYAARASMPVNTVLGAWSGWQRARVSFSRVAELLDAPTARPVAPAGRHLPATGPGALEFRNVGYRLEAGGDVLRNASFNIVAGSKTVLSGASGGGKSTLADMLQGHVAPHQGAILIDGVDIAQVSLAELRRCVAVVDQEPLFLPGTVADNLRHVRPGAADAELEAALAQAGIDTGRVALDRPLGAAGAALSRGERMRVALARAILQQPTILVLDETTSAVDIALAQSIMASVDRVFAGRTRIVITHDRRLAGPADAVAVLRNGRIAWEGATHADAG